MAKTAGRRERRRFTNEFKAGVVRLVLDEGKTAGAVARELDLTDSAVRAWVAQAEADRTKGKTGLTTAEREELARLRKENRELKLERDIPRKAAAFFAKESNQGSRSSRRRRPQCRSPRSVTRSGSRAADSTRGENGPSPGTPSAIATWAC
jgi:transposase